MKEAELPELECEDGRSSMCQVVRGTHWLNRVQVRGSRRTRSRVRSGRQTRKQCSRSRDRAPVTASAGRVRAPCRHENMLISRPGFCNGLANSRDSATGRLGESDRRLVLRPAPRRLLQHLPSLRLALPPLPALHYLPCKNTCHTFFSLVFPFFFFFFQLNLIFCFVLVWFFGLFTFAKW